MRTKVTLADVAKEAGVSTQTVSRAINNKGEISESTRQRVLLISQRLGYRPNRIARSLVTKQTMIVGLIVPDITNPFFSEVALGAGEEAFNLGYNLILLNSKENPTREQMLLSVLDEAQVDGVLLCSSRLPDDKLIPMLSKQKTAVLVNRCLQNQAVSSICIDDYDGAIQALNHLFSLGRRTIGFVCGPPQSYAGHNRMKGYRQALLQAGMPIDPRLNIACEPTVEDGREATLSLLSSQPNIDGLLCYNDLIAIGAIQACRELGVSVPDQVAVIGFDDILLGRVMTPALTTLHVSKLQVGARALQLLMNQIRGQNPVENVLVKEELIIRQSAA